MNLLIQYQRIINLRQFHNFNQQILKLSSLKVSKLIFEWPAQMPAAILQTCPILLQNLHLFISFFNIWISLNNNQLRSAFFHLIIETFKCEFIIIYGIVLACGHSIDYSFAIGIDTLKQQKLLVKSWQKNAAVQENNIAINWKFMLHLICHVE